MYKFVKKEAIYITFYVPSLISENVPKFLLFFKSERYMQGT